MSPSAVGIIGIGVSVAAGVSVGVCVGVGVCVSVGVSVGVGGTVGLTVGTILPIPGHVSPLTPLYAGQ